MTEILRWENPPARTHSAGVKAARWAPVAAALDERPGEWAVIAEGPESDVTGHGETANSITGYIRSGTGAFAPPDAFECRMVTVPGRGPKVVRVYARFVPPGQRPKRPDPLPPYPPVTS